MPGQCRGGAGWGTRPLPLHPLAGLPACSRSLLVGRRTSPKLCAVAVPILHGVGGGGAGMGCDDVCTTSRQRGARAAAAHGICRWGRSRHGDSAGVRAGAGRRRMLPASHALPAQATFTHLVGVVSILCASRGAAKGVDVAGAGPAAKGALASATLAGGAARLAGRCRQTCSRCRRIIHCILLHHSMLLARRARRPGAPVAVRVEVGRSGGERAAQRPAAAPATTAAALGLQQQQLARFEAQGVQRLWHVGGAEAALGVGLNQHVRCAAVCRRRQRGRGRREGVPVGREIARGGRQRPVAPTLLLTLGGQTPPLTHPPTHSPAHPPAHPLNHPAPPNPPPHLCGSHPSSGTLAAASPLAGSCPAAAPR